MGRMNQKGRVTGQDEQNQEQKGCRINGNERSRGQDEQNQEQKEGSRMNSN